MLALWNVVIGASLAAFLTIVNRKNSGGHSIDDFTSLIFLSVLAAERFLIFGTPVSFLAWWWMSRFRHRAQKLEVSEQIRHGKASRSPDSK
jgi:hypothetical protein